MPALPVALGGTGKSTLTPGVILVANQSGNGFTEYTPSQLNTLLGNSPVQNQSPVVAAGQNQTISTSNTTLTATASDSDGTIASILWTKQSGPQEPIGTGFNGGSFTPLRTFTIAGTSQDLAINSGNYQPGDLIYLDGDFRSITLTNVAGTQANPIVFRNAIGKTCTVGNPTWAANGGPSYAIQASGSSYFIFAGTHWDNFIINGSDINTDGGGEPYRSAYRNISMDALTENFEFCYMTINDGGTSVVAKTDPLSGQSNTWYPNRELGYMLFHDMVVDNSYNEGFYIGHTATYWNITNSTPLYPTPYDAAPNSTTYKQPILINGLKIWNCRVTNAGKDGIQVSACKNPEVYQNEVYNWANVQHNGAHNGGILIGGRCLTSNTHDNITHDAWGEHFQFYGTGPGHLYTNNLCYNVDASSVSGDMASLAGRVGTNSSENNPCQITMTGNTFVRCGTGGSLVRVNGVYNKSGGSSGTNNVQLILNKNLFIAPKNNTITNAGNAFDSYYVYTENPLDTSYNIIATKGTGSNLNQQYNTIAAANVDTNNYYLPNSGAITQGFRKLYSLGPQTTVIGSTIVSPNTLSTAVTGLIAGVYIFRVKVTDNAGATAESTVQVTVTT
jgi:hypothetical protein